MGDGFFNHTITAGFGCLVSGKPGAFRSGERTPGENRNGHISEQKKIIMLDLQSYDWPIVTDVDIAFPVYSAPKELVTEAAQRGESISDGRKKFNQLFFSGGKIELQPDVKGTWKEKAFLFARALMGSWNARHEEKELVCGLIFQETLILNKKESRKKKLSFIARLWRGLTEK